MRHKILIGAFPENGALGEYFFGFGTADIVDPITGIIRKRDIDPGFIVLNYEIIGSRGTRNSTSAHEGTHSYLGHFFFLLQKMHGHDYCSYMCKRVSDHQDADLRSPIEKMEIQANTFPRYLLIPEKAGKERAARLLAYYGGIRNLATMQKMVDLVNAQDADLVLTAGDFLTSTYYGLREPEVYQEILKGIKSRYGSYGVYGNHDVEEPLFGGFPMTAVEDAVRSKEVTDFICGCGMEVLSDEVVKVVDDSIVLVLREDGEKSGRGTEERLTASELMKGIDTSLPVLVLEHEPVDYKNLKANGADLALSGHTHAGQIFPATLFTPFFNENNYGFKVVDDLQTVVTSGVGYYGPPLRVGCDSEIMVVNVYFTK